MRTIPLYIWKLYFEYTIRILLTYYHKLKLGKTSTILTLLYADVVLNYALGTQVYSQ